MKTPTIRYFLEKPKSRSTKDRTEKELIMAEVNYGFREYNSERKLRSKPFRISLQCKILPSKFGLAINNFKFDKNVFDKATKNNATYRTKMFQLQAAIDNLESRYTQNAIIPKPEAFKSDLMVEIGRVDKNKEEEHSILAYLYAKIKKSIDESGMSKRNSLSLNTIKTYRSVSHLIENYQIAKNEVLTFENFDEKKYWEFWNVMDDILKDKIKIKNPNQLKRQRKKEHGYLVNTLRKYQSTLIRTLKDAKEDKELNFEFSLDIHDKNLILEKQNASKDMYITENELQKIIDTNVDCDKDLQIAKEYIIIGSLTGMRYESMFDTKNTKVESCNDKGYDFQYIHSKQFKTSTSIYMPLLKPVKDILIKYDNKFPVVQSNPIINSKLKRLFEVLEINEMEDVVLKTYRSGEIKRKRPKYLLISTHDCRKTFYTNLFNKGMNPEAIDNMTHPDKSTENRMASVYNKSTMLDKAKMFVDGINKIKSEIYTF